MKVTFRTLVRSFLVVAGVAFIVLGVTEGETFELVLGVVSVLIGSVGLWVEWKNHTTGDGQEDNL